MAELTAGDLPASTLARFADNDAAQAAIDAALAAARRYCGWYVSPVQTDVDITLDGPGGRVLSLPTLNLLSVSSVDDDGIAYVTADLRASRRGLVTKRQRGHWSPHYGSITATITHGLTEAEAADWRAAIVKIVDAWARTSQRDGIDMKRKRVDDVEYEWFDHLISTDQELATYLSSFRILPLS